MRPYGVSKGTALSIILERLSEQHDLCEEADGTSPVGGASKGGENRHPSPPHLGVPAAAAEESRPATPRVSASASPAPDARGAEGATPDERERHVSHFRWVLCMSEVMARDEDLFTTIKELAEEDESITAITCCVGKTLSQAETLLQSLITPYNPSQPLTSLTPPVPPVCSPSTHPRAVPPGGVPPGAARQPGVG